MTEKKTSIRKKVASLAAKVSLVSVLVIGVIMISGLFILRENTVRISGELGEVAAGDSQKALEERMIDRLVTLAENMAALSDATLLTIQNSTEMIAQAAGEIIQNPGQYPPNPVPPPNAKNAGLMAAQFQRAQGTNLTTISEEAARMGNIQNLLMNIIRNNININTTINYIGSELGYLIVVDDASDRKTEFFDPRDRPWYKLAVANNKLSWTDIYTDAYGRGLSITCAKPYYDNAGRVAGVAGVGTLLNHLTEIVVGTKAGETGYSFILNELGQIIISESLKEDEHGNVLREDLLNGSNGQLASVAREMTSRKNGIERVIMNGREYFIAYAALEILPWSLATVIEVNEAIAPALESRERIISMKNIALRDINLIIITVIVLFVIIITMICLFIGYSSQKFASNLTMPITVLQEGVQRIANGNLEHNIDIRTGDEIETLGLSVNKMAVDLRDYIANLQKVTAEKERIGAELNVARDIQASMLPCIFPPFPDRPEFDIYAIMQPAKEVGGDFYDFFLIDNNTLAVVIADVSGKGVPAALFMVIAKTLIKNNAQNGKSPKEVFETVNKLLCENNETGMFVTVFMGYLDIPSGRFTYVNAGHNPPLFLTAREKANGARFDWLQTKPGLMLAFLKTAVYSQNEIMLNPGDELLLYTDGITEAMNNEKLLFGEERLLETANSYPDLPLKEFTVSFKREIDEFAQGEEQADDITMLSLRYRGQVVPGTYGEAALK
ncbi:MAG: SpoIIE family protein phosphatase [Treponema sp.]|jgi:sigma-B regulation protein RsbU (phosphoserine phosphatase)|nr:SpoIIE family protein phosphatase [Treponema sp.]